MRAVPLKKKVAVYCHAHLIWAGDDDWWDKMTNNYNKGGDPEDRDDIGAKDKSRYGSPILFFVLPTWTNATLPPNSTTLLASLT